MVISYVLYFLVYRYDVFDVHEASLQYTITVTLLEYNGFLGTVQSGENVGNWSLVSSFDLSPSRTVARSPDGRVSYASLIHNSPIYKKKCSELGNFFTKIWSGGQD